MNRTCHSTFLATIQQQPETEQSCSTQQHSKHTQQPAMDEDDTYMRHLEQVYAGGAPVLRDADWRGHDGNANTVGIGGSTNGNRVNDFGDEDIHGAKKVHEVLVRADIGARSWINKESSRIVNRGCVESVQLSGCVRKLGVVAKADAEVGNRREVSHGGQSGKARKQ
jgi:hypothetical protein